MEKEKNKELLTALKQFDNHPVSNGEESIEGSLVTTTDGIQWCCIKMNKCVMSRIHSMRELGAVLITARYFANEDKYFLKKYDRKNQDRWDNIGSYKTLEELMNWVVVEVSEM